MRFILALLCTFGLSLPVAAQTKVGPAKLSAPADITVTLTGSAAAAITMQATGGGSYTGVFQVSDDDANWISVSGSPQPSGMAVTGASGDGFWLFAVGGYGYFRLHVTAVSTPETFTAVGGPKP